MFLLGFFFVVLWPFLFIIIVSLVFRQYLGSVLIIVCQEITQCATLPPTEPKPLHLELKLSGITLGAPICGMRMKLSMPVPAQTDALFFLISFVSVVVLDTWKCSLVVPCVHRLSIPFCFNCFLFVFAGFCRSHVLPLDVVSGFQRIGCFHVCCTAVCFPINFLCIFNRAPSCPIARWLSVAALLLLVASGFSIVFIESPSFPSFSLVLVMEVLPVNVPLRFTYCFGVLALDVYQRSPGTFPGFWKGVRPYSPTLLEIHEGNTYQEKAYVQAAG